MTLAFCPPRMTLPKETMLLSITPFLMLSRRNIPDQYSEFHCILQRHVGMDAF